MIVLLDLYKGVLDNCHAGLRHNSIRDSAAEVCAKAQHYGQILRKYLHTFAFVWADRLTEWP